MQGNDISIAADAGQGVIFEGLIASPPQRRFFKKQSSDLNVELRSWKVHDLPLKALIDTSDRLGVSTEVYTFLNDGYGAEAVDYWLTRKGLSLPVYGYYTVEELAYDLRFKRSIRTIFVPTQEQAAIIGMRATVVDPQKAWTL